MIQRFSSTFGSCLQRHVFHCATSVGLLSHSLTPEVRVRIIACNEIAYNQWFALQQHYSNPSNDSNSQLNLVEFASTDKMRVNKFDMCSQCRDMAVVKKFSEIVRPTNPHTNIFDDPFWGFYWPGGQAVTRYILDRPKLVYNKRILDFACQFSL
jgi:hypothetical protein